MLQAMIFRTSPEVIDVEVARRVLLAAGLTPEQIETTTGFGRRHEVRCLPVDSRLNKFAAGALSLVGVMGDVFGTDTVQHHRGHNVDPGRVGSFRMDACGDGIALWYRAGADSPFFGPFEQVCVLPSPRAVRAWLHSPPAWFGDPLAAAIKARDVRP